MSRGEAWSNHAANLLVGASGLVYGWMRYFAHSDDPYAVVNHPQEPLLHALHLVFAPLLVFAGGMIWSRHVWARVRTGFPTRRPTGLVLALLLGPMAASGYLLQVSSADPWRRLWIVVHVATSLAWLLGYAVHQLSPRGDAPQANR